MAEQRACGSCGAANPAANRFCGECGSPLVAACPSCGAAQAAADQRFCGQCGAPLAAAGGAPAERAPDGSASRAELRLVSVLFVDLVGYTSMSEQREAEDVRELLSGYFDLARTVVERYGGVVEKYIGDAVMAVWGARVAQEDDPERAVRAAMDLVGGVPAYGEQAGVSGLAARAAVVTGQAAAVASPTQGIVVGDRVNTAARAQAVAQPGQVLVDDTTRRLTQTAITYEDAGEHAVKGKAEPLRLWRAVRVVAGVGGRSRVDGLESDLVGRARELNLVKELFHATLEDRRARMLLVTGAAGVGKSRLRWEFATYIDGVVGLVFWHQGRCVPYGDDVSFDALAEMLRDRFGIEPDTGAETVEGRVAEALLQWVVDPAERAFLTPRLAGLVGATRASFGREDLFGAWRLFFQRLSETSPVVLVVEDLQWADAALLEFLAHLFDYAATSPIFVLGLARPEISERWPGWPAGRHNVTALHLEPLPDAVMERLVDGLVPGMPPEATSRIVRHAEGIPLYAVETVRSLIDRDVVVPLEGHYRLVGEVGELEAVPASLTGLIASRLDGLPEDERSLVKDLAVLGQSFPRSSVAAASRLPDEVVDSLLAVLVRKQVLTVRDDPLSVSSGHYMFVQSMLRSVAYDTLSRRERRSRHLRLADHLQRSGELDADETSELVASHLHQAYLSDPGGADSTDLRERAVQALELAARRAGSVGAPDRAEQAYRTAAELASDDVTCARLTTQAGRMARQAGRSVDSLTYFESVVAMHEAAGRTEESMRAGVDVAVALIEASRYRECLERAEPLLRSLDRGGNDPDVARLENTIGVAMFWQGGREAEATPHIERGLTIAAALELSDVQSYGGSIRALMLGNAGRYGEALAMHRWAADIAEETDNLIAEFRVRGNIADQLVQMDLPGAHEATVEVLELSRRLGDRSGESYSLVNLAEYQILTGRWSEAEAGATTAAGLGEASSMQVWARARLLLLDLYRGDQEAALAQAEKVGELEYSEDVQDRPVGRAAHGVALRLRGDLQAAVETGLEAVREACETWGLMHDGTRFAWPLAAESALLGRRDDALAELLDLVETRPRGHVPPFLRAEHLRLRAGLAVRRDAPAEEVEHDLTAAVSTMEELDYPYWRALAQRDLGRWLTGQEGRAAEAEKPLRAAAETLVELGAVPALEEVNALLAGGLTAPR